MRESIWLRPLVIVNEHETRNESGTERPHWMLNKYTKNGLSYNTKLINNGDNLNELEETKNEQP